MSWGERSCGNRPCPRKPTMETCNVDCPDYQWDGVTKPDSNPGGLGAALLGFLDEPGGGKKGAP